MRKSLFTLDDLVQFCSENHITNFSEKETGYSLRVQVPVEFEKEDNESDTMMFGKIKLMHTGRNRNNSFLTDEAAEGCMGSIKYKPLLANFCEYEDEDGNMVKDFTSHDMEINEDGTVTYLEKQIGCFTAEEPYLEDEGDGRKFIFAQVAIPREYTDACEIIERKGGTKVSAELDILAMSYDAKEKVLVLEKVEVLGATCLGVNPVTHKPVEEGMQGARLDIEDFSSNNNPVTFDVNTEMVKTLQELNETLKGFNKENTRKEDGKLQEQFEENTNVPEEAEVPTQEFTENETTPEATPSENEVEPEGAEPETEPEAEKTFELKFSCTLGEAHKEFSLSLNEKLCALYNLVNETYGEMDNDFYDVDVYEDDKVLYMHGWFTDKHYKQSYKERAEKFSLVGDRVEVFTKYLTADEIKDLESMKANYSSISEKLEKYESEPEKIEILNSKKYSYVFESDEFKALKQKENYFELSVEEVENKANGILLAYAEKGALHLAAEDEDNTVGKKTLPVFENRKEEKSSRYGNLVKKK